MPRETGTYRTTKYDGEQVRAFVPFSLPPASPTLELDERLQRLHTQALSAIGNLRVAATMVPSADWFLYGFVRKEAVITSQIEGSQATLRDVLRFEATNASEHPEDVEEVCNYVEALKYARREMTRPSGLPLSTRLLCGAHKRLMKGARGADKQPGKIRSSQNWIGGSRPGNARFVPPPPQDVPPAMAAIEKWLHAQDPLPPLIRCGLAHVQFESIHPFLDGNGRIGRLLVSLLLEHWNVLEQPLLYLSLALKRRQQEYYHRLASVRTDGDWEGWSAFFLECVSEAASDAVDVAARLFQLVTAHRTTLLKAETVTVSDVRLLEVLPAHPIMTVARAMELLSVSKPTAAKAIDTLVSASILRETTGKQRDRVYSYHDYLTVLMGNER